MTPKIIHKAQITKNFTFETNKIFSIFGDDIRLVGGCVRDLLLQKPVNDFDFATKFLPDEIIEILEKNHIKAILTGKKFGTITAVINDKNFEITTLRKDEENDGRYAKVKFIDDYFEDATRRDFTINALYLDKSGNIYDYFEGVLDLDQKNLKFIGDANKRIKEDFLRILRFFRFNLFYAKEFDKKSLQACIKNKEGLKILSRERIRLEFLKIIFSQNELRLIEILKIFNKSKISQNLFSAKLDVKKLDNLFACQKILSLKISDNLRLAALFFKKDLDFNNFFQEICATKIEKKFFKNLQKTKLSKKKNLDLKSIQILLIDFHKDFVEELFIFNLIENFDFSKVTKDEIKQMNEILKYLKNFSSPNFPVNIEELKKDFLDYNSFAKSLKKAQYFWAINNFNLTDLQIRNFIKKISKY